MFKREKDRLHRDKEKVEKELQRKRVENDKIFQRKKDFDWMINELFEEGRSEHGLIQKLVANLREIREQLNSWEADLKTLMDEDEQVRNEQNENAKQLVKDIVDKEAEKQLLEVQLELVQSDSARMENGELTSLPEKLHSNQKFHVEKKRSIAQDFPKKVEY